jgi:phosphoheptose isomerase
MEVFEPSFFVYGLFRRDTGGICYVGKGHHHSRHTSHTKDAAKGKHSNTHLANIIRKHGVDEDFLIAGLTEAEAFAEEMRLIKKIGRSPNGPLVNRTDGGEGATGTTHTAEWHANHKQLHTGKKRSAETCQRISEAITGHVTSEEHRRKLSAATKGLPKSELTIARIKKAVARRANGPDARAVFAESAKAMWQNPDYVAKLSKKRRSANDTSAYYPARATNTRSIGTHGRRSLQIIFDNPGLTYARYIELGGRGRDMWWDVTNGNVTVVHAAATDLAEAAD